MHSLGAYWIVKGDDNQNASVRLEYRQAGTPNWHSGAPFIRVERRAHTGGRYGSQLQVPDDGWLFAGSVLLLEPGTAYELRLTLADPDGMEVTRTLHTQTRSEPRAPASARRRHVVPGAGGGTGSPDDPFKGLAAAQQAAAPGDLFLLHPGVYEEAFTITRSGDDGRPIVWRGSSDGEAIIDPKGAAAQTPAKAISATRAHDVWFENLTIRNATYGIEFNDASRLVIRRCHVYHVEYGLAETRDPQGVANDHFISDNLIEGPSTWPRTKGIENARGIQLTGQGHEVCYNRIRGFADAIDTFPSVRCAAIDIHNNELSELTDDGIEMDYSERNTRCFYNRMTNVFQGISEQPVYGGPVYIFRNVMYNVAVEPFKLHNSPSGCLIFHNTSVKRDVPSLVMTPERVRHCLTRNNLFVGTPAGFAMSYSAPMIDCDFDYDGFAGGPFQKFLRWNRADYATLDDVRTQAPVEKHAVLVDAATAFASGALPPSDASKQVATPVELRLSQNSAAVDSGQVLPGLNDGYKGRLPDLGAYELGDELPHYGPRAETETARE
jgi:Right handed beta helix region